MKRNQAGFTLIELVMVIVILGVLAAVALPKFVNLKGEAQAAATTGVAGSLASASSINYASRSISTTVVGTSAVANCSAVAGLIQGGMPSGYSITAASIGSGASTCTLVGPDSSSATFTAIGIS